MSTPLSEGQNYLFFPRGSFTGGKVTGFTNADVCVVCTPDYIFVLPKREVSSALVATRISHHEYFADGTPVEEGIQQMLMQEDMAVEDLEKRMLRMLGENNHDRVIKIDKLTKFKIITGLLGQARMKHEDGGATKVLVCKGKGAMKALKSFYK